MPFPPLLRAALNSPLLALLPVLMELLKSGLPQKIVLTYHGFEEYKTGLLSRLGTLSLPLISRLSARTIAVSDSLKMDLEKRWKAKPAKLVRLYNPVFVPEIPDGFDLPTTAQDLEKRENLVLSVGRLVPDKRFDLLIRSLPRMNNQNTRLIILGEGPERQNLARLIEELGLSNRVSMPGFVANTGPYYAKAKCFALTSTKESFGLVLVEALAFGLPVLSTSRGGPSELLENGRHGILLGNDPRMRTRSPAPSIRCWQSPATPTPRKTRAKTFDVRTGVQHYDDLFRQILREK